MSCDCTSVSECRFRIVRATGGALFEICRGDRLNSEEQQKYRDSWAEYDRKGTVLRAGSATPVNVPCSGCKEKTPSQAKITQNSGTARKGIRHPKVIPPGPCSYKPVRPLPFTGPVVRHLLYHIYPFDDVVWKWNLDELARRLDLFNGRRIVSIVTDHQSDSADDVRRYLGDSFEYIESKNSTSAGEHVSFVKLLSRLESTDVNECVFYAHAKGVTRRKKVRPPYGMWPAIQQWASAAYETCLDYWPLVREQLQQYAMSGSFQWRENVLHRPHYHGHHYSGTFWWFRSAHVYSRCWDRVEQGFYAAESWPGYQFKQDDVGNLFTMQSGANLYRAEYWDKVLSPALADWRRRHSEYRRDDADVRGTTQV